MNEYIMAEKMEKGQIFEIKIHDVSNEGSGIGRIQDEADAGFVVFVPGTFPGDIVKAKIIKVKKRYAIGELMSFLKMSQHRLAKSSEEVCPYSKSCGGCAYIGIEYVAQLQVKEKQVREKLERVGGVDLKGGNVKFNSIIGAELISKYRNKGGMAISTGGLITEKGGVQHPVHAPHIGFRRAKSREVIDCKSCILQTDVAVSAAEATRRFMTEDHICSYDTRWGKGLMKGMTVKTAFGTGEVMVVYDINGKGIPNAAKLVEYLDDEISNSSCSLESVIIRNEKKTETLAGKPTITDVIEVGRRKLQFEISADSFYQVNHEQLQKLYNIVRQYCIESSAESEIDILDLYCGIGTIGLCVADLAKHVYGVEAVKQAVIDANRNATINGIVNATYECAKAEEIELPKADVAILDPPRAGCKSELLRKVAEADINRIIYVSCDPATLSRDIKILNEYGYETKEATPIDMFPQTLPVECVVLMSREK